MALPTRLNSSYSRLSVSWFGAGWYRMLVGEVGEGGESLDRAAGDREAGDRESPRSPQETLCGSSPLSGLRPLSGSCPPPRPRTPRGRWLQAVLEAVTASPHHLQHMQHSDHSDMEAVQEGAFEHHHPRPRAPAGRQGSVREDGACDGACDGAYDGGWALEPTPPTASLFGVCVCVCVCVLYYTSRNVFIYTIKVYVYI